MILHQEDRRCPATKDGAFCYRVIGHSVVGKTPRHRQHSAVKDDGTIVWDDEVPSINAGPCGTCVTPQWCMRTGNCAQGKVRGK